LSKKLAFLKAKYLITIGPKFEILVDNHDKILNSRGHYIDIT